MEKYNSMLAAQRHQLYELRHKAGPMIAKKTWDSAKKLEYRVTALEAKTDNQRNESLFTAEKPTGNDWDSPALDRKGNDTRQSQESSWQLVLEETANTLS